MPGDDFRIELPFGPPPILPDIGKELEEYLTKPEKLPIHNRKNDFKFWSRKINYDSLYHIDLSPVTTTLKVERNLDTGELLNFHEIPVEGIGQTAKNSTSFSRPPGKATDDVRGSRTNYPFWPGGFDPPTYQQLSDENYDIDFENDLLTKAPGLSRGFDFGTKQNEVPGESDQSDISDIIDLRNIIKEASNLTLWSDEPSKSVDIKGTDDGTLRDIENDVIPNDVKISSLKISATKPLKTATKTEWAELLDTTKPVVNFHKKIVDPAVTWNFELDTFQKLAILKLEEHKHIFVAAHTSAGKTVVAEYAIGLSQKHCTKAIYTSPIKALSNQKYRDFKNRFEEVGLITGDYQVNQQASCLIMTTEILRSMLYAGSDVIRDLEFVIFDEVHYINDSERGHVWEEILIMLPDTVCIVMLSATVPNQLEFADWVGRIKRAKMFVVSTLKRPVPLQHYLYTGVLGKGENLFLIKDADGPFNMVEYLKAVENKEKTKEIEKAKKDKNKPKRPEYIRQPMKSEKQYWEAFALFLKKYEKLPVVAFTLSRNKCDRNAEFLISIDFTTSEEKSYINYCFNQSIKTLKPEDQNLPQIQRMGFLLSQGIGVHHSGILPILKEIVEILFQKSLVKFLFATETFAMGVNMPARTVAFDSIAKFDGYCTRDLQPAEYIQMAGRAGRRGQDETGTVIILCKNNVEKADNLKRMMLGDPTKLQSQFRITYSMILNLMRVKGMRVEDIMSHSFKELHNRRKLELYRTELKELEGVEDKDEDNFKQMPIYEKLDAFFEDALTFIEDWNDYSGTIFLHPKAKQELTPGRFIVITYKHYVNRLALILQTVPKPDALQFKALILCDAADLQQTDKESDLYYQMLSLSKNDIFLPDSATNHLILTITSNCIINITKFSIKIEYDLVIKDWEQRQIPRFKDAPPSKTCLRAVTELSEKSHTLRNAGDDHSNFIRIDELKITVINLSEHIFRLQRKKDQVESYHRDGTIPDFESAFKSAFVIKQKEARKEKLQYLLSEKSLLSYPDYAQKVAVLKKMKYINDEDIVEMKGRVACEMGSNELIITELIFQGTFSKFEPAEIAALLSCLVFQGKLESSELELTERLKEGITAIETVRNDIIMTERNFLNGQEPNEIEKLNFGLVKVVYEWAHGKAFAEIMELIEGEVQEGIIVRAIQQLNEILRDIKDAARLFGDLVLKKKMEEASEAVKRDIVFAASLYTQD